MAESNIRTKVVVQHTTATGESVYFELHGETVASLEPEMEAAYESCDKQLKRQNMRTLHLTKIMDFLAPTEKIRFNKILDFLHGQVSIEVLLNHLEIEQEDYLLALGNVDASLA